MQPLRFGPASRQLFGVLHAAEGAARGAALLCAPFGQEAIRVHRMYRVLGERLAREQIAVLRFDYFGAGDSGGDDADASLAAWAGDVLAAHAELVRLSGATRVAWIGLRLGATVAALAARALAEAPPRLVLWDPVVDGAQYLDHLESRHKEALEIGFGQPWRELPRALGRAPASGASEVLGFALPASLRAEITALNTRALGIERERATVLISPAAAADGAVLDAAGIPYRRLQTHIVWTSNEAMNTALVPNEILRSLIADVEAAL